MADWEIIALDGKEYAWNGEQWIDRQSFLRPSLAICNELNHLLSVKLSKKDSEETDHNVLLKNIRIARDAGQYSRAEKLGLQAKQLFPESLSVAATLASVYRAWGKPKMALKETNRFVGKSDSMLLTVRAAALCDLERWVQAKQVIGAAYALSRGEHVKAVYARIRAARPDLFT